MGRRDELMSETSSAFAQMQTKVRGEEKAVFERLRDVPLSQLTVGDLVAIVEWKCRGYKVDYHTNVPWVGDVAMLEKIAKRIGR